MSKGYLFDTNIAIAKRYRHDLRPEGIGYTAFKYLN